MQSLQPVSIIVNILFIISNEGVQATILRKARICDNFEDNNDVIHQIVQEVASTVYKKNFKGIDDQIDEKNEVIVITLLLNALKRNNEQKKVENNAQVKAKKINDGNIQLFSETENGRLLGRSGIKIDNFLNDMRGKFDGRIDLINTVHKPYPPNRAQDAGGGKTSGHNLPQRPQCSSGGLKTSGHNSPQGPQGGAGSKKTSNFDPYPSYYGSLENDYGLDSLDYDYDRHSSHEPLDYDYGWKSPNYGPYSPIATGGCKKSCQSHNKKNCTDKENNKKVHHQSHNTKKDDSKKNIWNNKKRNNKKGIHQSSVIINGRK